MPDLQPVASYGIADCYIFLVELLDAVAIVKEATMAIMVLTTYKEVVRFIF
jgi:hypothetical protein